MKLEITNFKIKKYILKKLYVYMVLTFLIMFLAFRSVLLILYYYNNYQGKIKFIICNLYYKDISRKNLRSYIVAQVSIDIMLLFLFCQIYPKYN